MKLYLKPGACSLASHIVLREIEADFDIETVDTAKGLTASGGQYAEINEKGYVPTLAFDDDSVLTEGPAILQYLADSAPASGLLPAVGTVDRARVIEQLTFTSSELHKAFSPLFRATSTADEKASARVAVAQKLAPIEYLLSDGRSFITGEAFTIADAYLFVVTNWTNFTDIDLQPWPNLARFMDRVAARPATRAAMQAEGLIG